jgi:hypothetical protein
VRVALLSDANVTTNRRVSSAHSVQPERAARS